MAVKTQGSYDFTNLSVIKYRGEKFLTTTKNYSIVDINPVTVTVLTVPSLVLEEETLSKPLNVRLSL